MLETPQFTKGTLDRSGPRSVNQIVWWSYSLRIHNNIIEQLHRNLDKKIVFISPEISESIFWAYENNFRAIFESEVWAEVNRY